MIYFRLLFSFSFMHIGLTLHISQQHIVGTQSKSCQFTLKLPYLFTLLKLHKMHTRLLKGLLLLVAQISYTQIHAVYQLHHTLCFFHLLSPDPLSSFHRSSNKLTLKSFQLSPGSPWYDSPQWQEYLPHVRELHSFSNAHRLFHRIHCDPHHIWQTHTSYM